MEYEVIMHFKVAAVIPELKEIEDRVNSNLAGAGALERLQVLVGWPLWNLSVPPVLTDAQEKEVAEIVKRSTDKITALSGMVASVELRRKSTCKSEL